MQISSSRFIFYFANLDNENGDESEQDEDNDDDEEAMDEEEEDTEMKEVVMNFADIEKR
jgi:hypothetical protein